ncbi:thioesterase family protein, partial [Metarhizium majus ARSEF 297]
MATEGRPSFADAIKVEKLDSQAGAYICICGVDENMVSACYESAAVDSIPTQPDLQALAETGSDEVWAESKVPGPLTKMMSPLNNWRFFVPRKGPLTPGVMDVWLCLSSGELITQATLPYVVDSFPYNLHLFLISPELRATVESPVGDETKGTAGRRADLQKKNQERADTWFPTVVLNLENKTALPEQGAKWLNMRITSKQISNGKFDPDIIVRDADGELVALSSHVAMVLSMSRNTGEPLL